MRPWCLGATSIPILSCKTSKWRFQFNPPTHHWKRQVWLNIFFVLKHVTYHRKQDNCERSTYYNTITLIDQNIKYYNLNNKILHLISHMAFQVAPLIGVTEPSNSVPGNSDKQAQFLTADNFKIIWKLNKILVRVMRYNICDRTQK